MPPQITLGTMFGNQGSHKERGSKNTHNDKVFEVTLGALSGSGAHAIHAHLCGPNSQNDNLLQLRFRITFLSNCLNLTWNPAEGTREATRKRGTWDAPGRLVWPWKLGRSLEVKVFLQKL